VPSCPIWPALAGASSGRNPVEQQPDRDVVCAPGDDALALPC